MGDIDGSIRVNSRITVTDGAKVTFEDSDVDRIESNLQVAIVGRKTVIQAEITNDCDVEPDVRFGKLTPHKIILPCKDCFDFIQGVKDLVNSGLIGLLTGNYSSSIHTVYQRTVMLYECGRQGGGMRTVDAWIYPLVYLIDLSLKVCGVNVQVSLVGWKQVVESRIEDANDLRALVVNDCMVFLVPQGRNTESSRKHHQLHRQVSRSRIHKPGAVIRIGLQI